MRRFCFVIAPIFFIVLFNGKCYGQDLSIKSTQQKVMINGETLNGYKATVDFPIKTMKKEFRQFAKQFAKPKTKRTHMEVEIPPSNKKENTPLLLMVRLEQVKEATTFFAGLKTNEMSAEEIKKYSPLAGNTLREFQIYYYKKWLQNRIDLLEIHAKGLGKKEGKLAQLENKIKNKKGPTDEAQLKETQSERARVKEELKKVLSQIDGSRARFKEIK